MQSSDAGAPEGRSKWVQERERIKAAQQAEYLAIAERAAEGGLYASALPYLKMAAALAKSIESFVLTEHKNKTKKGFFGGGGDTADTKVPAADNNLDAEPKEGADKGDDDEADDEDESSPSVLFPLLTVAIRSRAPALQTPRPSRKKLRKLLVLRKPIHFDTLDAFQGKHGFKKVALSTGITIRLLSFPVVRKACVRCGGQSFAAAV